jgi:hypothetical protein
MTHPTHSPEMRPRAQGVKTKRKRRARKGEGRKAARLERLLAEQGYTVLHGFSFGRANRYDDTDLTWECYAAHADHLSALWLVSYHPMTELQRGIVLTPEGRSGQEARMLWVSPAPASTPALATSPRTERGVG